MPKTKTTKISKKKASTASKKKTKNSLSFSGLKNLLRISAVLLVGEAVALLVLGSEKIISLRYDISSDPFSDSTNTVNLLDVNLAAAVAFMLLVSAASYFVLITTGFGWYVKNLQHKINYMRWLHHSVSTGFLISLFLMLAGVNSLFVVVGVIAVVAAVNLFGLLMELYNERRKKIVWNAYYYGVSVGMLTWLIILGLVVYGRSTIGFASTGGLIALGAIISTLILSFGYIMWAHYAKHGSFGDYKYSEKIYIGVNTLLKLLFGLVVYFEFL